MNVGLSDYAFFSDAVMSLQEKAKKVYGSDIRKVLQSFYENLKELKKINYCNYDVLPYAQDLYEIIIAKLSYEDIKKSFDYIYENYDRIISVKIVKNIIKRYPKSIDWLTDKIIKRINKHPEKIGNDLDLLSVSMGFLSPDKAELYLDKIFDFPNEAKRICCNFFFKELYANIPTIRSKIFNFLVAYTFDKSTDDLFVLYSNLYDFTRFEDFSYFSFCINNIERDISNPNLSKKTLEYMIKILAKTYQITAYKEDTKNILKAISSKEYLLDINVKRSIARITEDKEDLRSSVMFGQRVERSLAHPYGYAPVEEIPIEKPCILIFGGSGVDNPRKANNNMGDVRNLLEKYGLEESVDVYSVVYNFGDMQDEAYAFDDKKARKTLLFQHGRRRLRTFMDLETERYAKPFETTSIEDTEPRYVQQIFDTVFLPRISQDGHRIDVETAKRNIRNITVYAHCHGGYTFLKTEELMQQKMVELGYTNQEIRDIQKQLLCVAYAPYCPLGVSKSTMISFLSAKDYNTRYYNLMELIGRNIMPNGVAWLPGTKGNLFVVPRIAKYVGGDIDEHGVAFQDAKHEEVTEEAQIMLEFRENAVVNSVKNALANGVLPSVEDIVTNGDERLEQEFITATKNGKSVYDGVSETIKVAREAGKKI